MLFIKHYQFNPIAQIYDKKEKNLKFTSIFMSIMFLIWSIILNCIEFIFCEIIYSVIYALDGCKMPSHKYKNI
jgi:hypothetical protein